MLALIPLVLVPPGLARASSPLDAADRAYDEGRIADARRAYEEALELGTLEPSLLVRAYVRLGILAALAGEDALSQRYFEHALALDPVRDTPEELSPRLRARFEVLRAARGGQRVVLAIDEADDALVLSVRHAPVGLAHGLVVRGAGGFERREAWQGRPVRIEVPDRAGPIEAQLLDVHGNRLARAGARLAPVLAVTLPEEPERRGRNLLESPWLWVAVGAIVIGIGVTIGVGASGDRYRLEAPVVR